MSGRILKWHRFILATSVVWMLLDSEFVLQECTTDSEELIYPVRAPSSCSAPPDLLMVSDRETVQLTKSANMISTSKGHHPDNHHHHHSHNHNQPSQYSHHPQSHQHQQQHHQPKDHHQSKKAALVNKNQESPLVDLDSAELNGSGGGKSGPDERIRLEEFTCDVSVESGKSSQPLQFSFTFYDLDGHHGKITKDDIAGIVYTIYESIGKSVVVPYCGSKTINVRLTVSPEAKAKSGKLKKVNTATTTTTVALGDGSGGSASADAGNDVGGPEQQPAIGQHQASLVGRRQHRYRPRKLIKSDDEEDDADTDSEKEISKKISSLGNNSNSNKFNDNHIESKLCCTDEVARNHRLSHSSHHAHQHQQPSTSCKFQPLNITENIYESVSNLKFGGRDVSRKDDGLVVECKECVQSNLSEAVRRHHQQHAKHILTRTKLLRRTRKHKDQCVAESRQRSLSVGNESSWKMRGVHLSKNMTAAAASASTTSTTNATGAPTIVDEVDGGGGGLRGGVGGGSNQGSPPNTECWNNALKRNDLIDIIRASMEKNRLCFQGSGKPYHHQNGLSPGRHRQRSHTISKIVNDSNTGEISHHQQQQQPPHQHHHQQQQQHQLQQQQTSHHIPIYHQQMAINPALLTPHPKTNLCGYDSFLHATICTPSSTSANNSPNSAPVPSSQQQHHHVLSSPTTNVPPSTKAFLNNIRQQQRASKQQRNGGYHSQQNSPQFHGGYLLEPQKLNSSLLNALNPHITSERKLIRTIDNVEKWLSEKDHLKCPTTGNPMKYDEGKLKKDEKNYDNLLYSKLNEKFLDVSTASVVPSKKVLNNNNNNNSNQSSSHHHNQSNKENERQHHHSHHHNHSPKQRLSKYSILAQNGSISPMNTLGTTTTTATGTTAIEVDRSKFVNLIPIDVDPVECENLIHPTTSDEESSSLPSPTPVKEITSGAKYAGGKNVAPPASKKNGSGSGDGVTNGGSGNSSSGASNNGNNSTSSTVHRYVHEHIHHHYHHFENKDD